MANRFRSRGFLSGCRGQVVISAVVSALVVFLSCFAVWYNLGGGAWRGVVKVLHADQIAPDMIELGVGSCNGDPELVLFGITDDEVLVKVIAFSTPMHGGEECLDIVTVHLGEPLGDRVVVDNHTGKSMRVRRTVNP